MDLFVPAISGEHFLEDDSVDIGEPHIAAAESVGKASVVDAQQMEHGGMEVVNFCFVCDGFVAKFVGGTVNGAAFDTPASHPHGKAKWVMIASVTSLSKRRASELAGPDHECLVEESALFEVCQECGDGLVDGASVFGVAIDKIGVLVPAIAVAGRAGEFDKTDTAFDKAAGEQTFAGECPSVGEFVRDAVHVLSCLGFVADVHQMWNCELHFGGEFVITDGGFDLIVVAVASGGSNIERTDQVELTALLSG